MRVCRPFKSYKPGVTPTPHSTLVTGASAPGFCGAESRALSRISVLSPAFIQQTRYNPHPFQLEPRVKNELIQIHFTSANMFKAALPTLVIVILGMLSVARAVDVTDTYGYYPAGDLLHVDANAGAFKCPLKCASFLRATGCTNNAEEDNKKTTETCTVMFGKGGAAHKICGNTLNGKRQTFTCDVVDTTSTALPALVAVTLGMLSVARAVDLTDAYRYYPDGDLLHVDANAGSFKCPRNCAEFFRATGCTNNDVTGSKVTNETCSSMFGANGAAHKTCGGFVNGKRHTYTCDHLDPASKFVCSGCTATTS
ncbi:hypothetical protein PSTT_01021 [Puccinia striiformis]|uniref:Uncharacterized protein n=1 Tax=Puccinia striiformis TaxID=27350 RepID=A0A2S4W521_9BASI|nr:hypothetical protein PSTT_01021 [Puccinia striiformis]